MSAKSDNVTRVLVTGASGYVASTIVNELLVKGYTVRGTVRSLENSIKIEPLKTLAEGKPGSLELVETDLLKPETWSSAVADCSHVLHIASPYPFAQPRNADEVIRPAVEGTLSILKACVEARTVKRVVMTSSATCVGYYHTTRPLNEDDWTDPKRGGPEAVPYVMSKVMAEKEAYKYVDGLEDKDKLELCTICPSVVIGPSLTNRNASSLDLIKQIMTDIPLVPNITFHFVDVRDVADAHIMCMTSDKAPGNRFLITGGQISFLEIGNFLYEEFHHQGYSPPTRMAPRILIRLMALFDESARTTNMLWGVVTEFDNSKMKNVLGMQPRDIRKSVIEMVYSLIDNGYIKKTKKYKGRQADE